MNEQLIEFICAVDPEPLQTGRTGRFMVSVQPAEGKAYCRNIVLSVPCGDEKKALFSDKKEKPRISMSSPYWMMLGDGEESTKDSINYYTYTLECKDASHYLLDYNLVFQIEGQVNKAPGQTGIEIIANCSADGKEYHDTDLVPISLEKACAKFYLKNFAASAADAPLIPCTEFEQGSDIRLSWESNGSYFRVYAGKEIVYSGKDTYCMIKGGVKRNTTYFLCASLVEISNECPDNGFTPLYLYENLSVTVTNQDLTINQLDAKNINTEDLKATKSTEISNVSTSELTKIGGPFQFFHKFTSLQPGTYENFKAYRSTTDLLVMGFQEWGAFETSEHLVIWQEGVESRGRNFVCRIVKAGVEFYLINTGKNPIPFSVILLGDGEIVEVPKNDLMSKENLPEKPV